MIRYNEEYTVKIEEELVRNRMERIENYWYRADGNRRYSSAVKKVFFISFLPD